MANLQRYFYGLIDRERKDEGEREGERGNTEEERGRDKGRKREIDEK